MVELRSDARDNMLGALLIAGEYVIPEVGHDTVPMCAGLYCAVLLPFVGHGVF